MMLKDKFRNNGMVVPGEYDDFDSAVVFAASEHRARGIAGLDNFISGINGESPIIGIAITSGENGSVSHDQENDYAPIGTIVTATAVPNERYQFVEWLGPVEDKYNPVVSFELNDDTYLKATFRLQNV